MKTILMVLLTTLWLLLNGCAGPTPIQSLVLPPVSAIEGTITRIEEGGFTLRDSSGSIYVKAEMPDHKKLNLAGDEKIRVYGNLQGGRKRIFDGYVIRKSTGENIIINNPSPHFGFILQTGFKE